MDLVAKFDGEIADLSVLPAFEGAQSLEGISRSLVLISHYLMTGDVRKRYPFDNNVIIVMEPPRRGSFEAIYSFLTDKDTLLTTTVIGAISVNLFSDVLKDTFTLIGKRLIGRDHTPATQQLSSAIASNPGNFEALGEAIEPALKKAHTVINNGAGTINIFSGGTNFITLDARSKSYINTTIIDKNEHFKLVSCGMLNANTRNGRVYDQQLGRTVPIRVPKDAESRTLGALAQSLQKYSSRRFSISGSEVAIRYRIEASQDGEVKKYIVYDAYEPIKD